MESTEHASALHSALQDTRKQKALEAQRLSQTEHLLELEQATTRRLAELLKNLTRTLSNEQKTHLQEIRAKVKRLEQHREKLLLAAEAAQRLNEVRQKDPLSDNDDVKAE